MPAYRAQSASLYDGTAGIALFLSHLVRFTGDSRQRITLEGALNQVRQATSERSAMTLGYYGGLAGIVSVLLHAGETLRDERWSKSALDRLALLATTPPDPARLDVMSGSAGTVPMLVYAAKRFGREDFLDASHGHGDLLLGAASPSDAGSSWLAADGSRLIGYTHGAGGIACALLDLAVATGENRYRDASQSGLRFERSHFSEQWRNWPDLRGQNAALPNFVANPGSYPVAWCHGATGVGFSRLRMQEISKGDDEISLEIETAVETTRHALAQPAAFGQGYSLCHGAAGQADLLIEASSALGRPDLFEQAAVTARTGAALFHDTDIPWPSGVAVKGETPNLMLGIAGIGYFYLRLHAQDMVPSILLQTPKTLLGIDHNVEPAVGLSLEFS